MLIWQEILMKENYIFHLLKLRSYSIYVRDIYRNEKRKKGKRLCPFSDPFMS